MVTFIFLLFEQRLMADNSKEFGCRWNDSLWAFPKLFQPSLACNVFNIWKGAGKSNKVKYVRNVLCLQTENTKKNLKNFNFFFPTHYQSSTWTSNQRQFGTHTYVHSYVHRVVCDVTLCEFKANIVCEHYFNWSLHSFMASMKLIFWQI